MKINFWQARRARKTIATPYKAFDTRQYERTLTHRYNGARGGKFAADDLKNAAFQEAASLAQGQHGRKVSALQTLFAYLGGKIGKLQIAGQQLGSELGHLEDQRNLAVQNQFNDFREYENVNPLVKFFRWLAPTLVMLLIVGLFTVLDYAINSSRITVINNARLDTILLTRNDILLSNLAVVAISLVNNVAPFIAGMAYQNKMRGRVPVSTAFFIGIMLTIAFLVNAIIPSGIFALPNVSDMQKLMSLMPYCTSMLGFLMPILTAKNREKNVEECDVAITEVKRQLGDCAEQIQRMQGEYQAASVSVETGFRAAENRYFSVIEALFCRFTTNHTPYRPRSDAAPQGQRRLPGQNGNGTASASNPDDPFALPTPPSRK
jgi:hypothetical protein